MPLHEQPREDLLAEATALVQRVEVAIAGQAEHVVIGFRRDGCASFYFGSDPAWHFNTRRELRRAFIEGVLYKSEQRRLIPLRRERAEGEVRLVQEHLSDEQQATLIARLEQLLSQLQASLTASTYHVVGQVPAQENIVQRISGWLTALARPIALAASPHAR